MSRTPASNYTGQAPEKERTACQRADRLRAQASRKAVPERDRAAVKGSRRGEASDW